MTPIWRYAWRFGEWARFRRDGEACLALVRIWNAVEVETRGVRAPRAMA